jgi:hypothetical protein
MKTSRYKYNSLYADTSSIEEEEKMKRNSATHKLPSYQVSFTTAKHPFFVEQRWQKCEEQR